MPGLWTDGPSENWFLDAWNVLDGVAFASLRLPEADEALTSVALGPPDWSPVALGRLSTGWAATRYGGFQRQLRGEEGEEVAFPSLALLREFVRRAYLAGGLGSDDPGEVPAPRVPPLPEPLQGVSVDLVAERDEFDVGEGGSSAGTARFGLGGLRARGVSPEALWDAIALYALALEGALDSWSRLAPALGEEDPRADARGLLSLYAGLAPGYASQLAEHFLRRTPWPWPFWPGGMPQSVQRDQGLAAVRLLSRLPAIQPVESELPRPRTLADQLLLACASRRHLRAHRTLADVLPLWLASVMVISPATSLADWQLWEARESALHEADVWLREQLPDASLDRAGLEPVLDEAVQKIADYRLRPGGRWSSPPRGSTPQRPRSPRASGPPQHSHGKDGDKEGDSGIQDRISGQSAGAS